MPSTLSLAPSPVHTVCHCSHCGEPTGFGEAHEPVFCCSGCATAFHMIHHLGLEDYYALRTYGGPRVDAHANIDLDRRLMLDNLEAAGVQVHPLTDGLCSVRLAVDGLHCAACTWLIERVQTTILGLESAQVRMSDRSIELIYDPARTEPMVIANQFAKLGYCLSPWTADSEDTQGFQKQQREHWLGIATAAFFAANAMWIGVALYAGEATGISAGHEYFLRWVGTLLGGLAIVFPGRLFFRTAWQAIRSRTPHVDIPVAISLTMGIAGSLWGAASGVGDIYFDSLASLILLLRIGRYIQFRAQYRTSLSLAKLLRWNSNTAVRLEADGSRTRIPASRLNAGDQVEILPGEMVPADGLVISGDSCMDWSLLNGENRAKPVSVHDALYAGTTNVTAPLTMSVTAVGSETRMGRLMELVRKGASQRTPSIEAADRVSKWFVAIVLLLGAGTWLTWTLVANASVASETTMALLTIACPCALALAAPLVLTVAMGKAARRNIWIRDGACLERLAKPGMLWLDKTGTLTTGKLQVLDWHGDDEVLPWAMSLEKSIQHPIAKAICSFASQQAVQCVVYPPLHAQDVSYAIGKGAAGYVAGNSILAGTRQWLLENGVAIDDAFLTIERTAWTHNRSVVWLAVDGRVRGLFELGDPLRPDAKEALRRISSMGWKLGILSGDRQELVDHLAQELRSHGIDIAQSLGQHGPEEKLQVIQRTKANGIGPCAMVGDGVNDAAALAAADVGIAIRGGSDQALQAAPIYIANGSLSAVLELMQASGSVVRGIRRCFAASLIYNTITLTMAMLGWIHPLIAAVLMPISGLTVLTMAVSVNAFKKGN